MENREKVDDVIKDIVNTCSDTGIINHPINLTHTLIAYLRVTGIKTEDDYMINSIIASTIRKTVRTLDKIELTIDEICRLCTAVILYDDGENIELVQK